jgi:hypothetical protein
MKEADDISDQADKQEPKEKINSYDYGDLVLMIWRRIKLKEKFPAIPN